jgi:hypothetical protein
MTGNDAEADALPVTLFDALAEACEAIDDNGCRSKTGSADIHGIDSAFPDTSKLTVRLSSYFAVYPPSIIRMEPVKKLA